MVRPEPLRIRLSRAIQRQNLLELTQMPLTCTCKSPAVRPSNPYVCIDCGGMRPFTPVPRRSQPRLWVDVFGDYDPPEPDEGSTIRPSPLVERGRAADTKA